MPHLDCRLLGGFSLTLDGAPLEGMAQPRLQALVAYLALHRSTPVPRAHLAAALWPETSDEQALKNLRTLLARLRAALPEADRFVAANALTVEWCAAAPCTLDVAAFEDALARAAAAPDARAVTDALAAAVDLYSGDLLAGRHDEWLLPERERLRAAWLAALEELTSAHESAGRQRAALAAAQRLSRADPLHEGAYTAAMRAQLALGDRAGALRTYHACAALLRDELGVDPGPTTQAMYERVLMADEEPVTSDLSTVNSETLRPRRAQSLLSALQSPPLIGRAAELAWLQERWLDAASGAAQVALVAGEAGIGKTRLAEELLAWVERQEGGADIAVAHCYAGGQVAYAPVAEWLRSPALGERLRAVDAAWRTEAARLLPELLADAPVLERPGPVSEAWQRHRFLRGLASPFLEAPAPCPLLLVLEDVQWADAETVDWLPFLVNAAADAHDGTGAPLLLLLTLRAEETPAAGPLATLRHTLQRSGRLHEVTLHPLDAQETAALAASLAADAPATATLATGRHPVDSAGQDAAARLFRDTEGNPLFIVETVRAGQAPQSAALEAGDAALGLPPRVLATLRHRLGQLSAEARTLAEHAAVLGRAFRHDALASMLGNDGGAGEQDEETLVRGLDELWRTRIVREQGADAYDFSHDKLRAVAYAGLSSARRRLLHRRAAAALERLHAANLTPVSADIGNHFEEAGEFAAAIPHYRRAAEAAQAVYATSDAIRLYRHLLGNELAPLLSTADRCDLLLALCEMLGLSARDAEMEEAARAAIAEAAVLGDSLRSARAHYTLGLALADSSHYDAALPVLAQARAGFEAAGDRPGLLRALTATSTVYVKQGETARALELAGEQLALAAEIGDPRSMVDALLAIGEAQWVHNQSGAAEETNRRALALAEAVGCKPGIAEACNSIGLTVADRADAVRWFLRSARISEEIGEERLLRANLVNISVDLAERGEYAPALALLARAAHSALNADDPPSACRALVHVGRILVELGRPVDAEALLRAIIAIYEPVRSPVFLLAMYNHLSDALLEQGRTAEAAAVLEEAYATLGDRRDVMYMGKDRGRQLAVSSIRTRLALGQIDAAAAVAAFDALQSGAGPREGAIIAYRRWQATGREEHRVAAAAALRDAYPVDNYFCFHRTRYHELTGNWLPEPPPLPDVSARIPAVPDLDALLARITALLPALIAEPVAPAA